MREQPERRNALGEFLLRGFANAVADIRSKVIFEGWFGRRDAMPAPDDLHRAVPGEFAEPIPFEDLWGARSVHPGMVPQKSFEDLWGPRDRREGPGDVERSAHDHDLDR